MQIPPDGFGGLLAADQVRGWVMHPVSPKTPPATDPESQPSEKQKTAKLFNAGCLIEICHGVTASKAVVVSISLRTGPTGPVSNRL
jgi:hypothetical protein